MFHNKLFLAPTVGIATEYLVLFVDLTPWFVHIYQP